MIDRELQSRVAVNKFAPFQATLLASSVGSATSPYYVINNRKL